MNRGNEPAFPIGTAGYPGAGDGLTIREQFALHMMAALRANGSYNTERPQILARYAIDYANALLAALAAEQPAAAPAQKVNDNLLKVLRKIAYEPIGHAEASAGQMLDDITQIARAAIAEAETAMKGTPSPAQSVVEKLEAALHSLYDYGCEERLPSSNSLAFAKEALEEAGAAP